MSMDREVGFKRRNDCRDDEDDRRGRKYQVRSPSLAIRKLERLPVMRDIADAVLLVPKAGDLEMTLIRHRQARSEPSLYSGPQYV